MFIRRMLTGLAVAALLVAAGGTGSHARTLAAKKGFVLRVELIYPLTGDLSTYGPSLDKGPVVGAQVLNAALKQAHIHLSIKNVGSGADTTRSATRVEPPTA